MTSCLALPDFGAMRGPSSVACAMSILPELPATSPLSRAWSSSSRGRRAPFHAERTGAGIGVHALAGAAKSLAFVEGQRAGIVGIDVELEKAGGKPFGFRHEIAREAGTEGGGTNCDLIQPAADAVENHEAGEEPGRSP